MAFKLEKVKGLSSRAGKFLLAGTLACALTPTLAFAADSLAAGGLGAQHYDPEYVDLAIIGNSGDPLGGGIKVVKEWDGNNVQYMGYAHGDGSHYKGYSIYTDITVDDNGVLTALDITSGTDTFAGKWGYNNVTVEGLLPKGVSFSATQDANDEDGNAVWVPMLSGADDYGYALSSVTLMSVNATGDADARGVDQNFDGSRKIQSGRNQVAAPKYTSTAAVITNGKITVPKKVTVVTAANTTETQEIEDASYYNLVKCTYTIGTQADKTQFNTYFMTGGLYQDAADGYLDNLAPTTFSENPTTGYTTNRDGWTSIMGTMVLRQLGSWGAYLNDPSVVTGDLDGELASIDTVSGATKTSLPLIQALNEAKEKGYIKSVSENVKLTIDGANDPNAKSLPALVINNDAENNSFQDVVNVAKGEDGLYTVEGSFNKTGSGGRLSLDAIWLVNMSGQKMGTQGTMALAKEIVNREDKPFDDYLVASYHPEKFNISGEPHLVSFGSTTVDQETNEVKWVEVTEFKVSNSETVGLDSNILDFSYLKKDQSTFSFKMKVKDPKVTHVVMTYTLGHAKASSAYDLAEQLKVPKVSALMAAANPADAESVSSAREAYDALTYDVRPYTTGINNLEAAEAELVAAQLSKVNSSDKAAVQAARAAYEKLDASAKAKVDAGALANLVKAEKEIAEAAAAKPVAKKANPMTVSAKSVKVKAKKVKKKAQKVAVGKAIAVAGAQGKVTYKLVKVTAAKKLAKQAKKKIKVASNGQITLKKGLKKGTYKVTVHVSAAGNANYSAVAKTVTVKVKVK